MSIKSITMSPPISLKRNCFATSSAASRFVLKAVFSILLPLVDRLELTSTETSASVWSITSSPPDGSLTSLRKADSI